MNYRNIGNIAGWIVFAIATIVYYFSVERTGSLWDCGEFIAGAYKLQVVHPPGAPLFLLVGRMFTWVAELFSSNPENIAFAVNMMSGICTAFAATFVCWVTFMLGKLALVGREETPTDGQTIALAGAGIVAGLCTTFATSIWFSAVEGEVYAMSTFFTALTLWSTIKWYYLSDTDPKVDRWLLFSIYTAGLSIGVHLLSILTFPALALFYYFKRYKNPTIIGMGLAAIAGVALISFIQTFVIVGIPKLWSVYEMIMVNSFGLPKQSGVFPLAITVLGILAAGFWYAHQNQNALLQKVVMAVALLVISFSTIGVVVIRANANTPINMNNPDDPIRLLPYLNREQYGERPLLRGPHFDAKPIDFEKEDRYGYVEETGTYEIVDRKISYVFADNDKILFPRMGDYTQGRPSLYRNEWMGGASRTPTMADNLSFLFRYQLGWMYWRYFMWNFAGRQNGDQGFTPSNVKDGNWLSGIPFYDNARLYNHSKLPEHMANNKARNTYYMLPFLFGIFGLIFHASRRRDDFLGLLSLFIITGIGIIIYSNQPPHEPRERDYVLAGSFFTYSIWIGMAVLSIFELLRQRANLFGIAGGAVATAIVIIAPIIMGFENFDDHTRKDHKGSRDYAANFLNSVEENAIIFTYGDNDTYPLWYTQEVEEIRTDVRVVNLSLIAVDWYIDQLRRKVNNSPAIKMSLPKDKIRGYKRNQVPVNKETENRVNLKDAIRFVGEDHPVGQQAETYLPSNKLSIPVDKNTVIANNVVSIEDTAKIVNKIDFKIKSNSLLKGDLAVLDIIASNLWERPIYFAVTCRQASLVGLQNYTQLEGLALRLVPIKSDNPSRSLGMIGNGSVNVDKVYENVMNKWKWGNFDKEDVFIDRSYGPSIQSMQLSILRTVDELIKQGDTTRAIAMTDKYFEAFPNMNFTYNFNTMSMINNYVQLDELEKAKPHIRTLAKVTSDELEFLYSIDQRHLDPQTGSFGTEYRYANLTMQQMKPLINGFDEEFKQEINNMLAPYEVSSIQD